MAGLAATVAVGTLLLLLPLSTAGRGGTSLGTALFTATSASCDVGLTVVDTGTYWSPFGQVVILVLIQVGGLGLMISASLLGLVAATRLGLQTRLLSESGNQTIDLGTVRRVVFGSVAVAGVVEAVTVVVLGLRLWLGHGYGPGRAAYLGLFHGVAAFNNAGFTLWPDSLSRFGGDALVLMPILVAVVLGGLGYPVVLEALRVRMRRWSLHTRLTLLVTAVLLVVGPLAVMIGEWTNPATLGGLDIGGRLVSGTFAGVSPRTAGFAPFDFGHADFSTLLFTDLLMLIGAGSASTAGGIKVTTVGVLVLAVVAEVRGHDDVNLFARRIAPSTARQALAVCALTLAVVGGAALALLELTGQDLDHVLFEVSSAFGTVGLTVGVTDDLGGGGKAILVALMLAGRIGPVALATALALRPHRQTFRNAEARPVIG